MTPRNKGVVLSVWQQNITKIYEAHVAYIFIITLNLHTAVKRGWWRHQMETFSALLALSGGNSPVTSEFPPQRPVTRSFMFSLICAWINGWVNNREAGEGRHHSAHYDVIVMGQTHSTRDVLICIGLRLSSCWLLVLCCQIEMQKSTHSVASMLVKQPWPVWPNERYQTKVNTTTHEQRA